MCGCRENVSEGQAMQKDFHGKSLPLIIAHRGDSANFPENTIPAFESALAKNADIIEIDVFPTKDRQVVLLHDQDLERTTSGRGKVWNYPLAELKKLDAGSWFDAKFKDTRLPTLEEVLDKFGGKMMINIEIKHDAPHDPGFSLEKQIIGMISERKLTGSVFISSFDYEKLRAIRSLSPDIMVSVLAGDSEKPADVLKKVKALNAIAYSPKLRNVSGELVKLLHDNEIMVIPWVSRGDNNQTSMSKALKIGCDGFFADDPALWKRMVENYNQND